MKKTKQMTHFKTAKLKLLLPAMLSFGTVLLIPACGESNIAPFNQVVYDQCQAALETLSCMEDTLHKNPKLLSSGEGFVRAQIYEITSKLLYKFAPEEGHPLCESWLTTLDQNLTAKRRVDSPNLPTADQVLSASGCSTP